MRVAQDVYFRKYGDQTYVRHVGLTKDFLMNETAFDILDYLNHHEGSSLSQLCEYLKREYEISEDADFEKDIQEFTELLAEEGVLLLNDVQTVGEEDIRAIVQQKCFDHHWLFTACLELTYRCNEKCIHCYADTPYDSREELSTEQYLNIINQLHDLGCMGVLLTGGEATLRQDFFEIAEYIKKKGMLVDVYTNGLMLSDAFLDRLIALHPNSVSFRFYGGTPVVHDLVTTVPGSFEKSLKSLMTVKCAGIDTYIKTVVMRQNVDDYENLLKLGRRLGTAILTSISIMPSHGGKSAEQFRLLNREQYCKILELQEKYQAADFGKEVHKRGKYICASGLDALSIDPFGDVHPCNAHPLVLGNVKQRLLKDIWEKSEELLAMQEIRPVNLDPKCNNCEDFDWCSVCMGSAIRENGKLAPCSDTCMIANAYHCMYKIKKDQGKEELI